MSVQLFRVDERLIHGQVVIGWGTRLEPVRYIVVDDALAASDWEQELYLLGLPEGVEAVFASVSQARDHLEEWRGDGLRSILLTRDVDTMLRLARGGIMAREDVNLGGIHFEPGRTEVLSYLYLSPEDRGRLATLGSEVHEVTAQDLPASSRVGLRTLLHPGG